MSINYYIFMAYFVWLKIYIMSNVSSSIQLREICNFYTSKRCVLLCGLTLTFRVTPVSEWLQSLKSAEPDH